MIVNVQKNNNSQNVKKNKNNTYINYYSYLIIYLIDGLVYIYTVENMFVFVIITIILECYTCHFDIIVPTRHK